MAIAHHDHRKVMIVGAILLALILAVLLVQHFYKGTDSETINYLLSNRVLSDVSNLSSGALEAYRLGEVYQTPGKCKEAMGFYRTALNLERSFMDCRWKMVKCLVASGQDQQALELALGGVMVSPRNSYPYLMAAYCSFHQGQFERSASYIRQALSRTKDPDLKRAFAKYDIANVQRTIQRQASSRLILSDAQRRNIRYAFERGVRICLQGKVLTAILLVGLASYGFILPIVLARHRLNESDFEIMSNVGMLIFYPLWMSMLLTIFLGSLKGVACGETNTFSFKYLSENYLRLWAAALIGQIVTIIGFFIPFLGQFFFSKKAKVAPLLISSLPISMAIATGKDAVSASLKAFMFAYHYLWFLVLLLTLAVILARIINLTFLSGLRLAFSKLKKPNEELAECLELILGSPIVFLVIAPAIIGLLILFQT
jgi:tetratricopeptide (TPR) repeat protein